MFTYLLVLLVGSLAFRNAYTQNPVQLEPQLSGAETQSQSPYQAPAPGNPSDGKEAEYEEIAGNEIDNEYKESDFQDNRLRIMLQPKKSVALNTTSLKTWGTGQGTSRKSIPPKPNGTSRRAMDHTPERENPSPPNVLQALPDIVVSGGKTIEVKTMVKKSSTGKAQAKAVSIAETSDTTSEKSQEGNQKNDNISVFAKASPNGKQIVIESPNTFDNNLSQVNGLRLPGFPNNFVENFMSSNKTVAKPLEILNSLKNIAEFSNNTETEAFASVAIEKDAVKSNLEENEDEKSNQNQTDKQKEKEDEKPNQTQGDAPKEKDGEEVNQNQVDISKQKDEKPKQIQADAPKENDEKPNQTQGDTPKQTEDEGMNQNQVDISKQKDEKPKQIQADTPKEKDGKPNQTQGDTPKQTEDEEVNQNQGDTPKHTEDKGVNQTQGDTPKQEDEGVNQTLGETPKQEDEGVNQTLGETPKQKDEGVNQTLGETPKQKEVEEVNQIQADASKEKEDEEVDQTLGETPKQKEVEEVNQIQADAPKQTEDEEVNQNQVDISKQKGDEKPNQTQGNAPKEKDEKPNQIQADAPKQSDQKIIPDTQKSTEKPNIYNPAPLTAETGREMGNTNQVDDLKLVNTQEIPEFEDSSEEEPCNATSKENDVFYEELEPDPTYVEDEIEYAVPQSVNDTKSGAVIIVLPGSGSDQMDMNGPQTGVVPQNMFGSDAMAKSIFHLLVNLTAINAINERNGRKILEELEKQKANLHHLRKQSDAIYHYITNMKKN